MKEDSTSIDESLSDFKIKRQILKTPHPKFYNYKEDIDEENIPSTTRPDLTLTTKDNSFFYHTNEETEQARKKIRPVFYKQENLVHPMHSNISDNFINFLKLKNEKKNLNNSISNIP